MSNLLIAFIFGVGASGWSYSKFMKKTGNNTRNSMIGVIATGLFGMLILWAILAAVMPSS